jgi:hypothetical protein
MDSDDERSNMFQQSGARSKQYNAKTQNFYNRGSSSSKHVLSITTWLFVVPTNVYRERGNHHNTGLDGAILEGSKLR